MDISKEVTSTLRANAEGHPPVICVEWCGDKTSAPSGGNTIPDVVYPVNLMVATRGGRDDMRTCFGIGDANDPQFTLSSAHEHGVCYEVDEGG